MSERTSAGVWRPAQAGARLLWLVSFLSQADVGSAQDVLPEGWKMRGSAPELYRLGVDTVIKHSGDASAFVWSASRELPQPEGAAGVSGSLLQTFRADVYRGQRVRMAAMVKSLAVRGWAGLYMRVDGEKKTGLAFDSMRLRPISGTKDWKQYTVVLDVPQEAIEIHFGLVLLGSGNVWVDDFSFETVGSEVKRTGGAEPLPREHRVRPDTPDKPTNLDFEGVGG